MVERILGLDIGIASVGWAVIDYDKDDLSKNKIIKSGVRIFTIAENPKTGESLSLPRRLARGARRTNKRKRQRIKAIKTLFTKYLDLSKDDIFGDENIFSQKKLIDVWQLRDKALKRKLTNIEFARVLTHISKRRGYKSNRKVDELGNSDGKKVLSAIEQNKKLLDGYLTIGQAIYQTTNNNIDKQTRRNKKDNYNHSVSRVMLEDEVNIIFKKQLEFKNDKATEKFQNEFIENFTKQNDFASVDKMVGFCTLEGKKYKRAPKTAYSSEEFVTLTKLINTKIVDENDKERYFTKDELSKLIDLCKISQNPSFLKIRNTINLDESNKFKTLDYLKVDEKANTGELINPEKEKFKSGFIGFHKLKKEIEKALSKLHWQNISQDTKLLNEIATIFSYHKSDDKIKEELEKLKFNMLNESEKCITINTLIENISFDKFLHLSIKAIDKLLPFMRTGKRYDEAVKEIGYKNIEGTKQKFLRALNKDEMVQMTNPVVKRAIAQTRKIINALIRQYGQFDKIHIELTREIKKSHKDRKEIKKGQDEYKEDKEKLFNKFIEDYGREPKGNELLKFKLLNEQKYKCVYSGYKKQEGYIQPERLLEQGYVEIDHILPFSKSLEDGMHNKVLCLTKENQDKKNRTPYEYFTQTGKDWHQFEIFVKSLHLKKAKSTRLLKKNFDENSVKEFRERNINDTAYMSVYIKDFIQNNLELTHSGKKQVITINGTLTNMLRHNWGIGNKSRDNHLHHAVDAIIIAFATDSEVQRLSTLSAKKKEFQYTKSEEKAKQLKFVSPIEKFRDEVQRSIDEIFVSFAPRRSVTGEAHDSMPYSKDKRKNILRKRNKEEIKKGITINGGIVLNGEVKRIDIFKKDDKYHFVFLYPSDFEKNTLPNTTIKDKTIDNSFEFIFSIFKDEYIKIKIKNEQTFEGYFKMAEGDGRIHVLPHSQTKLDKKLNRFSTGSLEYIKKYQVDPLGNKSEIKKEPRIGTKKQNNKKNT